MSNRRARPVPRRAELISVGTELLLGHIVDTNSAYLARRLATLGIDCLHMSTVGDNLGRARETVATAIGRSDLVVMTGGLGPTEDDLTREAIAAALGEEPAVDSELERVLREWFAARGHPMPESNVKQAWLIPSATALPNPVGTAPGWDVQCGVARIVAMPGVPREMTRMWEVEVEPTLAGGALLRSRTLKLLGIGESAVEQLLGELVRSTAPTVATYAKNDGVHIRITDKDRDAAAVDARIAAAERTVRERLGDHIWGADGDTLPDVIGSGLRARGLRIAVAESSTAGEVAALLAASGSADWFAHGVVLPDANEAALVTALAPVPADLRVVLPAGDGDLEVVLLGPEGERRVVVPSRSREEGRRRAALAALDVLRRALR